VKSYSTQNAQCIIGDFGQSLYIYTLISILIKVSGDFTFEKIIEFSFDLFTSH
jgi:hypothetical protein